MQKIRLLTIVLIGLVFVSFALSGCFEQKTDFGAVTLPKGPEQESKTEAFFCPQDQCEERAISAILGAEHSIDVAMYSFTSEKIAYALEEAESEGVEVRVVADYVQSKSNYSVLEDLEQKGIKVRIISGRTMHNKFMIIDSALIETGSYNWTKNGNEKNAENMVFIFDEGTAKEYEKEFFNLWNEAD